MKIALDTNCFIDAINKNSKLYNSMKKILEYAKIGKINIYVSRHTLDELSKKPDKAYEIAKTMLTLPYCPIGSWNDIFGTWNDLNCTWDDIGKNDKLVDELKQLAKSGSDIRDQGAYIDALHAGMNFFVTSDRQFVASEPAKKIENHFGLRVITPKELIIELKI